MNCSSALYFPDLRLVHPSIGFDMLAAQIFVVRFKKMAGRLEGKVAAITGGASGLIFSATISTVYKLPIYEKMYSFTDAFIEELSPLL